MKTKNVEKVGISYKKCWKKCLFINISKATWNTMILS